LTAAVPVSPIGPSTAAGAIDHAVDVMWGWPPDGAGYQACAVVEFVATDIERRWLVEVGQSTVGPRAVRATAGEPTATVRAPIGDLALWAWTRGGAVEITGDEASVGALDAVVANGMQ
jgi:hypothetical protein